MFNVVFGRPLANPEELIKSLRAHPAVKGVFHDTIVTVNQQQIPQRGLSTRIDRVDAELSHAISGDRGGVPVDADIAIIDSGVNNRHPDLKVILCVTLLSYSIYLPNLKSYQMEHYEKANECYDGSNHGTGVAGVAAAMDNHIGVVGTAPGARIWAIKVLDNNGNGDQSDMLAGLNYVAKYFKQIEVVNMSLEHLGCPYSPITQAISALHRGNVVVVVAAGNDNVDARSVTPACVPEAITVSAVVDTDGRCEGRGPTIEEYSTPSQSIYPRQIIRNPDDFIQSYSNYGSVVDLAAPAGRTLSTNNIGGYEPTGGTSAAAPHVAGAAALIKSLNPNGANPIFIDSFLKNTGTKAPPAGRPLISCDAAGRGYFDDRYGTTGVRVTTDTVKEPLLYMGAIR